MCVTPEYSYTSPGLVVSMLPPDSAARSTTTEPGFMTSIMSLVMSLGAGLPGMRAVVMTMSTSAHCCLNSRISACMHFRRERHHYAVFASSAPHARAARERMQLTQCPQSYTMTWAQTATNQVIPIPGHRGYCRSATSLHTLTNSTAVPNLTRAGDGLWAIYDGPCALTSIKAGDISLA